MLKLSYKLKQLLNIHKKENNISSELQELYKIIDDMLELPDSGSKELYNYYHENYDNNHGSHL
jgi:hypothetical protein